jgi:hypothetical protein
MQLMQPQKMNHAGTVNRSGLSGLNRSGLNNTTGFGGKSPQFAGVFSEFDFIDIGKSTMRHNQLIYGVCIVSRLLAASKRSWNEVREHAFRDLFGWAFWFYATPMILRGFLKALAPKDVQDVVIRRIPKPEQGGMLKKLNWWINPLVNTEIATTEQIKERLSQAIHQLKETAVKSPELAGKAATAEKALEALMGKARVWRNGASGFSIVLAIALLGISIPLFNIMMTKRNVEAGHSGNGSH